MENTVENAKTTIKSTFLDGKQFTANEAVKTRSFRLLWLMFFINITCGIGLVSAASPMAQSMTGMSVAKAAVMVGIIGLFNGFGRLVWATLSDYIGRPNTFSLIFIVDILMLVLMLIFKLPFIFTIALCMLWCRVLCSPSISWRRLWNQGTRGDPRLCINCLGRCWNGRTSIIIRNA